MDVVPQPVRHKRATQLLSRHIQNNADAQLSSPCISGKANPNQLNQRTSYPPRQCCRFVFRPSSLSSLLAAVHVVKDGRGLEPHRSLPNEHSCMMPIVTRQMGLPVWTGGSRPRVRVALTDPDATLAILTN